MRGSLTIRQSSASGLGTPTGSLFIFRSTLFFEIVASFFFALQVLCFASFPSLATFFATNTQTTSTFNAHCTVAASSAPASLLSFLPLFLVAPFPSFQSAFGSSPPCTELAKLGLRPSLSSALQIRYPWKFGWQPKRASSGTHVGKQISCF